MTDWFVTFGANHSDPPGLLAYRFWRVSAPTELEARAKVIDKLGTRWAFIYPVDDLPRQVTLFGLREVQL